MFSLNEACSMSFGSRLKSGEGHSQANSKREAHHDARFHSVKSKCAVVKIETQVTKYP